MLIIRIMNIDDVFRFLIVVCGCVFIFLYMLVIDDVVVIWLYCFVENNCVCEVDYKFLVGCMNFMNF